MLGRGVVYDPTVTGWVWFLVGTLALCWLWHATLGRGPLELLLHAVSSRAADVAPDVLPERRPVAVVPGLGVVPGALVLPHWSGERADWLRAADAVVPAETVLLGVPEGTGVLVRHSRATALGGPVRLVREGRDLDPGDSAPLGTA